MMVQGPVNEIEEIWKNGFKFNRERKFVPSCKTISGIEKVINSEELFKFPKKMELPDGLFDECKKIEIPSDVVFVYGVVMPKENNNWNTPVVYGVTEPSIFKNPDLKTFINKENNNEKD
jgi:hypothetical protein